MSQVPSSSNDQDHPSSSSEISEPRRDIRTSTEHDIDILYGEYVSRFAEIATHTVALLYARYSTRFQSSIIDQVRALLDHALAIGVLVPREMIFFDMAVRGVTRRRDGLEQVEQALRQRRASTLLVFSTSRLFRKTYRTIEFVESVHAELGVRCVFLRPNIDTDDTHRWEMFLLVQSILDQLGARANVANVQAAHVGLLHNGMVYGTLPFGYRGVPIEGQFTRLGRPRQLIEIDEILVAIVLRIYMWFVNDRLARAEIVRRLNAEYATTVPSGATSGIWNDDIVTRILTNERYRGLWGYGDVESVYLPGPDYSRQRQRDEPLAEVMFERLRIVSDDVWYAAQQRVAESDNDGGRRRQVGDPASMPKLYNRFLYCAGHDHDQRLQVAGCNGLMMNCPVCTKMPAEQRSLFSYLNRVVATRLISSKLQELVMADPELPRAVVLACQQLADEFGRPDPSRPANLRAAISQLDRGIALTRRSVGETPEDQAIAQRTISDLQRERAALNAELNQLVAASQSVATVPTEEEVTALLQDIGQQLAAAAISDDAAEIGRARRIVELLTGGKIMIYQMGERRRQHSWVQAKFTVSVVPYLVECVMGSRPHCTAVSTEVTVDIGNEKNPKIEQAWELYKQGFLYVEMKKRLGCSGTALTKWLARAAKQHDEEYVDGRKRRGNLDRQRVAATMRESITPDIIRLFYDNIRMRDIAAHLGVSHDTVTAAVQDWHAAQGIPVPKRKLPPRPSQDEGGTAGDGQAVA